MLNALELCFQREAIGQLLRVSRGDVQQSRRALKPQRAVYRGAFEVSAEEPRSLVSYAPYVFGGAMLVAAFAFAGHQMGENASAHGMTGDGQFADLVAPSSYLLTKGSLMPEAALDLASFPLLREQEVLTSGKGGFLDDDPMVEVAAKAPLEIREKPVRKTSAKRDGRLVIEPAGVDLTAKVDEPAKKILKKLAPSPKVAKIEDTFKLKRGEKQKVVAQRRVRLAEENCLARAIYFEARSESELGQLAVAKVILNRTRDPNYPKTICGVVYQGANRSNSCQFSFACDGSPDEPKKKEAWERSKRVAQKALAGQGTARVMSSALFYHADYVKPRWAKSMKRLIKIGRHIFYADS